MTIIRPGTSEEVSSTDQGMMIAIPLPEWRKRFGNLKPPEMADELPLGPKTISLNLRTFELR